jgi:hypothetical protein
MHKIGSINPESPVHNRQYARPLRAHMCRYGRVSRTSGRVVGGLVSGSLWCRRIRLALMSVAVGGFWCVSHCDIGSASG